MGFYVGHSETVCTSDEIKFGTILSIDKLVLYNECTVRRKNLIRVPLWEAKVLSDRASAEKYPWTYMNE